MGLGWLVADCIAFELFVIAAVLCAVSYVEGLRAAHARQDMRNLIGRYVVLQHARDVLEKCVNKQNRRSA
jgi:hypothetical protein